MAYHAPPGRNCRRSVRQYCSNYNEALRLFDERGGEEARRYLYQREYDRLDGSGKSRQLLAGLLLLAEPISFAALTGLFQFPRERVSEALSECSSVFLSTFEGDGGNTLYQLTPPCVSFIRVVSEQLKYFNELTTRVKHFKHEGAKASTPEEAAVIVSMERLIRQKRFQDIVNIGETHPRQEAVHVNPRVKALLGQAYSELGLNYREAARACFKHAEGLGYRDRYMMRRWFNMELSSGYGLAEAERICDVMIHDDRFDPIVKSEFWSKLGSCHLERSAGVGREKAPGHLRQSIIYYLEGLWVGKSVKDFDPGDNLNWLERPLRRLIESTRTEIEQFFLLLDALPDRKHDVDEAGIRLILGYLTRSPIPSDSAIRRQLKGYCARTVGKLTRTTKPSPNNFLGFTLIVDELERVRREIEFREAARQVKSAY